MTTALDIRTACADCFEANRKNCSGFVTAVGEKLEIVVAGQANAMVDTIRGGGHWRLLTDGKEAGAQAEAGNFVVGGMRGDEQVNHDVHGHVVVVVGGQVLAHGRYPAAWWGSLGGEAGQDKTVNWAWTEADRDRVSYAVWVG